MDKQPSLPLADRMLAYLDPCVRERTDQILDDVRMDISALQRVHQQDVVGLISGTAQEISDMNYQQTRRLFGTLHAFRDIGKIENGGERAAILTPLLITRDRLLEAGLISESERDFLTNSLLLARRCAPWGVNVLNPEWTSDTIPASVTADETFFFQVGPHPFWVRPVDENSSTIEYPTGQRGRNSYSFSFHTLRENDSALIGRRLFGSPVLGQRIPDARGREVTVECQTGVDDMSRGGLLLARKDGRIYLFDKGSRNSIHIPDIAGSRVDYASRTMVNDDGLLSFGQTIWRAAQLTQAAQEEDSGVESSSH